MAEQTFINRLGDVTSVPKSAVDTLADRLRGEVIRPSDQGFDAARAVWNAQIDRRPGAIARCAGAGDVMAAVEFATQNDLLLTIKGGGHSIAGNAVADGALTIDLSAMREVRVDPHRQTVRVAAGCLWSDVDAETQAFGLATTGGTVSHTGVSGLTLGGGMGHLAGLHGFTCDNLISVDFVTANGDYITVSEDENAELFWAVRGAGANFGVATSFEFRVHPVGPLIFGGIALFPIERAPEVTRLYAEMCHTKPDALALVLGMIPSPDGDPLIGIPVGWFGPIDEGAKHIQAVRDLGPIVDEYQPMPYLALQQMFDEAAPHGLPRYWKSGYVPQITDELIEVLVEHNAKKITPISPVLMFHIGGEATRKAANATAFGHRSNEWDIDIIGQWTEPSQEEASIKWVRDFWDDVKPFTSGVYVNHLGADETEARVRSAYGENWDRLVALKQKYDPGNVFRMNNNIPPN